MPVPARMRRTLAQRFPQALAAKDFSRREQQKVSRDLRRLHLFRCAHLKLCKNPIFQFGNFLGSLAGRLDLNDGFPDGPGRAVGTPLPQDDGAS